MTGLENRVCCTRVFVVSGVHYIGGSLYRGFIISGVHYIRVILYSVFSFFGGWGSKTGDL